MLPGMFARAALGLGGARSGDGHPHAGSEAVAGASSASLGDSAGVPLTSQRSRMTLGNGGGLSSLGPVRARSGVASASASASAAAVGGPRAAAKEVSPPAGSGQGAEVQGQRDTLARGTHQPFARDGWAMPAVPLQRSVHPFATHAVLAAAGPSPSAVPPSKGAPRPQDRAGAMAGLAALRSPPQRSLAADTGTVSPYSITGDAWGDGASDVDDNGSIGVSDDGSDDGWGAEGDSTASDASAVVSAGVKPSKRREDVGGAAAAAVHQPPRDVWSDDSDGDGSSGRSRANSPASSATADSPAAAHVESRSPLASANQRKAVAGAFPAAVTGVAAALPYAVSRARFLAPLAPAEQRAPAGTAMASSLTAGDGDADDGEAW